MRHRTIIDPLEVQDRLIELRNTADLSQQAVAEEIGTSQRAVGYWESNARKLPWEEAVKMLELFGCEITITAKPFNKEPFVHKLKYELGENLQQLRIAAGLSRHQLAKLVGVKYRSVYAWETGERGITHEHAVHVRDELMKRIVAR